MRSSDDQTRSARHANRREFLKDLGWEWPA
jgi:hypothetical protein